MPWIYTQKKNNLQDLMQQQNEPKPQCKTKKPEQVVGDLLTGLPEDIKRQIQFRRVVCP